jgi:hypothetical protein
VGASFALRTGSALRVRRGLVAVPVVAALAIGALVVLRASDDVPPAARQAIVSYQEAVHPLAVEWGKIEILGMRPAIGDLLAGEGVPAETIAGEARHWQSTLASLRDRVAAVPPPDGLEEASRLFDASLAAYIEAARLFEAAADGPPGDARRATVDRGIERAQEGARLYNEASLRLQAARKLVGLGPTEDFPNQPAAQ